MFKKVLKNLFKALVVILFLSLIASTIVLGVALYSKTNDYNDIQDELNNIKKGENAGDEQTSAQVEELKNKVSDLEAVNEELTSESQALQKQLDKYGKSGIIKGSIVPIVISGGTFNKYQFVCAENVLNKSARFCISVSAVSRNFSLVVPAGTYNVYSLNIDDKTGALVQEPKAYYTEYVKCTQEKDVSECQDTLSASLVNIEIKADAVVSNVDPIDWK